MRNAVLIALLLVIAAVPAGFPLAQSGAPLVKESAPLPRSLPRMIHVADFEIDPGILRMDQDIAARVERERHGPVMSLLRRLGSGLRAPDPDTPQSQAAAADNLFAETLVGAFEQAGLPARRWLPGAPQPRGGWIVRGRFTRIDQGNRVESAVIGFGQGEPLIDMSGSVTDFDVVPPLQFLTFGGANADKVRPGGAAAMAAKDPYVMAAKYVLSRGATDRDVRDLAERLATDIVAVLRAHGML